MGKAINLTTKDGTRYRLEFTRKTVKEMIENGFNIEDVSGDKIIVALPALFEGAFLANHRFIKKSVVEDIFSHIPNRLEFAKTLAEMYSEPINALIDEPEDGEGNAIWEVSE